MSCRPLCLGDGACTSIYVCPCGHTESTPKHEDPHMYVKIRGAESNQWNVHLHIKDRCLDEEEQTHPLLTHDLHPKEHP